ncbi:MAG: hypothetical protein LAP21_04730 [Acidobacteriia bacterium]|nr:hypothetical protein [Terriglobia bacterium]
MKNLQDSVADFVQGRLSGPNAIGNLASIWKDSEILVDAEKEQVAECALDVAISTLKRVDERAAAIQNTYKVRETFPEHVLPRSGEVGWLLFTESLEQQILRMIPRSDWEGVKVYFHGPPTRDQVAPERGFPYSVQRLEIREIKDSSFHVNLSAASWEFITNLGRILPIAYVLLSMHLPTMVEIGAAAEAVRAILMNVTRLRPEEAEQCVLTGILCAKGSLGSDPTTTDIVGELRKRACLGKPCKFAGRGYECSIVIDDVESILKFLAEKKVVKRTSAVAWALI